ncbi:TauD/TfdA family dioxygenase [Chitinophaga ginsengisegetis]|uniref:TauD/TfdA family dioxygenase n=1 Tax=Chitinophaga ginsengisegetis TaxID=393003 RepID=UPI000DBA40A5|nr:TauD/TfdA family dioxygenase [Chitinophaga ginsengisegetis]MDR6571354.1 alpha-ketoglutarate-dependent taurine dioxygenase [Chitinophaga ginsengisegetis]MDR6651088.1 alpha-ketoglutarate-dependent taurine dioxygenase [Chitinophaga ginsengisegetis]MDR6657438.1 alpha-ketoglutarate-dependent taurine dioxygenase [Chitinophaga ginsengisegetis]
MENNLQEPNTGAAVSMRPFHDNGDQLLPLLITPRNGDTDLVQWMLHNKEQFEQGLVKHGGILLRGFDVDTAEKFNGFMKCFNTEPLPYMFRSSPRAELDKKIKNIYLSTSYPNDRSINMHNESSYSRVWGKKIVFCCVKPSDTGGETPIADSRRVLQDIDPQLVAKFREKRVKYRRNLLPDLGMPWQEVFQTENLAEAEDTCRKNNISYRFEEQDHMIIEWVKPAVYRHPVSKEETWFNHVMFFNKFSRYEELGMEHDDFLPEEYLTSDTFFGDGTEITAEEYTAIKNAYDKNKIVFPYQKGDIIFLDNMLAAHGRSPYSGDRVIATAIIEAAYDNEF